MGAPGFVYGGICGNQTGLNGNITTDPLFTDAANGNFHVRPGSPVIDAGTSDQAPASDLAGNPRPVDGNGDGIVAFDLGAYESPAAGLLPDLTATKIDNVNGSVSFPNPWTWSIGVANSGRGSATFTSGQVILRDNLPISGVTFGAPSISSLGNISGSGTISCGISSSILTCTAIGILIIGTPGSFDVQVTATPTAPGNFANPRGGGVCAADPDGWIAESNKQNNNCSDAVNVIAADLRLTQVISGGVSGGFGVLAVFVLAISHLPS